jgi:hypothetical protein
MLPRFVDVDHLQLELKAMTGNLKQLVLKAVTVVLEELLLVA